ncbi:MAG: hypothetical protein ACPGWR_01550 [Ardenticatenaceae bacterium]
MHNNCIKFAQAQAEYKIERWLRRDQSRIRRVRKAFRFARIEYRELTMAELTAIWNDAPYLDFLAHYERVGLDLEALRSTAYWEHLAVRFRDRPYKRKKVMRLFPGVSAEKALEAWIYQRFQKFANLYETIKRDGWQINQPPKRPNQTVYQSYLSFIQPPLDPASLKVVFKQFQIDAMASGERLPLKLIDGHHRIAVWHALGGQTAPCGIYHLEKNHTISKRAG